MVVQRKLYMPINKEFPTLYNIGCHYKGWKMNLVSIRDYAESQGVSYEAVRKQVVRYSEELSGHITKQNRKQYLDEWAVDFLTERRQASSVVIISKTQSEESAELKKQIELLKNQLLSAQEKIIKLQEEGRAAIEEKMKNERLLEDNTRISQDLEQAQEKIKALQTEKEEAEKEASSYTRTFLGLYRKIR